MIQYSCVSLQGKTLFYEQNLKDHYARISAAEVFASDPNANLRIVIQKIAALLKTVYTLKVMYNL